MTTEPHSKKKVNKQAGESPLLTPPDATETEERSPSSNISLLILVCGLLLVAVALLVVFLPLQQDRQSLTQQAEQQESRLVPKQPGQAQSSSAEDWLREIDRLQMLWLQKQAEAEAAGISEWGGDAYVETVALAGECDRLLTEQQYLPAKAACEGAIEGLAALMAAQDVLFEEAIAAGLLALEKADPAAAAVYFQQALAINPDDERAISGVLRAKQLPAVLDALEAGLSMERNGDVEGALSAFKAAAKLDPESVVIQAALTRARAKVAEKEFQQSMSRALQALADDKLAVAKSSLQQAESIKPGDRAVRDLKQQLDRTERNKRLVALRQDLENFEQQERWLDALRVCKEALSLDAQAAFAASCKERATLRVDLDSHFKELFAKPERLFEDGPLQEAHQTLAYALDMAPRGSILAAQIDKLEQLIKQAEAEVEVVIISDGLTHVVIYHIGRLGLFQEKKLVLRTGDYIATGSRNGFRDVRQTLKIRPGSGTLTFTLRCEEPI